MSKSREQLEAWLKTIEVDGKVLDVGGSQNPIFKRVGKWGTTKGIEYKILDLEQPHETKQEPDIIGDINLDNNDIWFTKDETKPLGCGKINADNYFDVVFCIEVSEYWFNPLQALENINNFLKKGGILYISFHTLYGLHKPEKLDYLRYTKYGIEKLLKETGFEIEEIIPRPLTDDGLIAIKEFYKAEGMRILYNEDTFKEGWLVKAVKI